jgi:predicted RNase H-like HicB family nuclease
VRLTIKIHPAEEGGYWAEAPSLPGCFSQGETLDEVRANIREAIELYLEDTDEAAPSGDAIREVIEV